MIKGVKTHSLAGKRVAISGATGGLGRPLCRYLASLGASLVLLDRNGERSRALGAELVGEFPALSVAYLRVDMEDIASVAAAATELKKAPLHLLILNAGAYNIPRHKCSTGYDNVFQINFVSPYCLARSLAAHISACGGRVVAVGSIAHDYCRADFSDVDFSTRKKSSHAYGNSKRYLMFSLYALYGGAAGLAVAHPGISFTGITAHYPKVIFALIKHPMKVIFMRPRKACLSILRGCFEDCGVNEWIGPRLFNVWGKPKKRTLTTCPPDEAAKIAEVAERVWGENAERFHS
jgi:NAD(P)-dependent dehydrogenase (short-subunit alcohol dehydrogenase family)